MRKGLFVLVLTAALAIPSVASALVVTDHSSIDFTGHVIPCPSENLVFQGAGSIVLTAQVSPSGVQTATIVYNLSGVTAVGQTSGTVYRVVGVTATGYSFAQTQTRSDLYRFVQTWKLIPISGSGQQLSFQEVDTVVFDPSGNLVHFDFRLIGDCL